MQQIDMQKGLKIDYSSYGIQSENVDCLTISIYPNVISFCEHQLSTYQVVQLCHYQTDVIDSHLFTDHLISSVKHFQATKKKYNQILINYFTPHFTLCPNSMYSQDNMRDILEFNVGEIQQKIVLADDVNTDIKLIYAIDEQLKSTLNQLFPSHHLQHSVTGLVKLMLTADDFQKEQLLISVHENYIEVVLKKNHQLILANQYEYSTANDVLYYVLNIIEQYQLNPLTVNISLVGNMASNSDLVVLLKKYIKFIRFAIGNKKTDWSNISGMPQHYNYLLINRMFCE